MLFENLNQFGLILYFRKRLTNAMADAFAGAKFRAGLRAWDVSGMRGTREVDGVPFAGGARAPKVQDGSVLLVDGQ